MRDAFGKVTKGIAHKVRSYKKAARITQRERTRTTRAPLMRASQS